MARKEGAYKTISSLESSISQNAFSLADSMDSVIAGWYEQEEKNKQSEQVLLSNYLSILEKYKQSLSQSIKEEVQASKPDYFIPNAYGGMLAQQSLIDTKVLSSITRWLSGELKSMTCSLDKDLKHNEKLYFAIQKYKVISEAESILKSDIPAKVSQFEQHIQKNSQLLVFRRDTACEVFAKALATVSAFFAGIFGAVGLGNYAQHKLFGAGATHGGQFLKNIEKEKAAFVVRKSI